uniref:Methyltransferase FkbM domain-containing protein n=1 Tax=viral metagenome TaxID=1070528 RepID=A0A6C0AQV3_9ZZZZ
MCNNLKRKYKKYYMKIAVIDGVNQDIGLNILFPEADYFINNTEVDKSLNMKKYNIIPNYNWSQINDKNYDYLFIIIALYDAKPGTRFFKQNIYEILQREIKIINENNFKKVFIFDNYDYDYDPNEIINNTKINLFFKRNYNKTKTYNENVVPFPFIMFGETSIIEKIENTDFSHINKLPRIFFTGTLFEHNDPQINYYRNRNIIYNDIKNKIYNPGYLSYNIFLQELKKSFFGLDLNGVGDPNKRTFEILSQGTLRISEFNDLKWPFEEEFLEETIFKNTYDFNNKLNNLINNKELYIKCLNNQNYIYNKYFNKKWIKNYILNNTYMYYSQAGEDEFLNSNYFKNKRDGIYIELGALDGTLYSNTKFFEDQLGWKGILIEPHPYKFQDLKKNRPNNYLFNNLVSCEKEDVVFRYFVDNYSGVSGVEKTLPKEHFNGFFNIINEPQERMVIKPKSFTEIIKSTDIIHIDLLSLDVEGHEYEVLTSWDFSIPIDVILIETLGGSQYEKEEQCRQLLIKNGYKFDTKFKHNEVFLLDEFKK